jgi:hypothetical protein
VKTILRHSIAFLLFSNVWVALSVATLVLGLAHYYCITDCYLYATFAFLGTFSTYNFHRLVRNRAFQKAEIATERSTWIDHNRKIIIALSAIAAVSAAVIFFFLPIVPHSLFLLGGTGIIVFFYAIPVPGTNRSLRSFPGMKNLWIVLVWTVLVLVPLVNREKTIDWIDIGHIALLTYIQIIPFDIRDTGYDPKHMRTLPQLLGTVNARIFATALLGLLVASMTLHHGFHWGIAAIAACSLAGTWWKQRAENLAALELLWDGTLLVQGIFYFSLDCLQR